MKDTMILIFRSFASLACFALIFGDHVSVFCFVRTRISIFISILYISHHFRHFSFSKSLATCVCVCVSVGCVLKVCWKFMVLFFAFHLEQFVFDAKFVAIQKRYTHSKGGKERGQIEQRAIHCQLDRKGCTTRKTWKQMDNK